MRCDPIFVQAASHFADVARSRVLDLFRTELAQEAKPDKSLVTAADLAVEQVLRTVIAETFPDHGIIGEEMEAQSAEAEYQWVIDPIDGTSRFAAGHPQFATLIALLRHGRPVAGVIDMPEMNERWLGAVGWPTLHNRHGRARIVTARPCYAVEHATIFLGGGIMRLNDPMRVWHGLPGFNRLLEGEAYGYGLLSSGFADVVLDCGMKIWDFMALVPIVEGAGGRITDWSGAPLTMRQNIDVVASAGGVLHEDLVRRLSREF